MARILLRAHKHPFRVTTPRGAYRANLIGDNVGNLLFSNAAYRLLDTREATITTGALRGGREEAARLNGEVDHVVIPLANAFRRSFASSLDALSETIEHLAVPVTVLGVGAQLPLTGATKVLEPVRANVTRFVRAVLDRSPTIGVRGEITERYLRRLGFRDVDVIGCPSPYLHSAAPRVARRAETLGRGSRISLNLSPYVPGLGDLVTRSTARYPRLRYAAQHRDALAMLTGEPRVPAGREQPGMPTTLDHPLVRDGRTDLFVDPEPWIRHLAGFDFSVGTRIHGNIAALVAGTPAFVIAHDSRTLELARWFGIPHRAVDALAEDLDLADLYAEADWSAFNAGIGERFTVLTDFLDRHGLAHAHQAGEDPDAFARRVAATAFPGNVGAAAPRPRLLRIPGLARRRQAA